MLTRPMKLARYFCAGGVYVCRVCRVPPPIPARRGRPSVLVPLRAQFSSVHALHKVWNPLQQRTNTRVVRSPIRRYADVIVHRLLELAIRAERDRDQAVLAPMSHGCGFSLPARTYVWLQLSRNAVAGPIRIPAALSCENVATIAEQCNTRKTNAKKAQELVCAIAATPSTF